MASILKVNGRWRAQVRKRGKSLARTFDRKSDALEWAAKVEAGIATTGRAAPEPDRLTIGKVIEEYRRLRLESGRPVDPAGNEHYMLEHLAEDLGGYAVASVTSKRLVEWAQHRRGQGAGPYTINMELSKLGTVLRHVASFEDITLPDIVGTARPLLHHLQLIGGGNRRSRRVEGDELDRLLEHFASRPQIADALQVLAITGLRRGELCKMKWADLDPQRRAVLVHQRKHPRQVQARDEWVPLLGDAWDIVQRQPKSDDVDLVFNLHPQTLTRAFTDACRDLGIPGLHLHDLRREATSRLRELGFDPDERRRVTGHRSERIHERYVEVRLEDLHEKFDQAKGGRK